MYLRKSAAKVRISENNTKQKADFLFLLSNENAFEQSSKVRKKVKSEE